MRHTARRAAGFLAVLAALSLLILADGARAQGVVPDWNDPADTMTSAVGLHYGRVGGHGLSFRFPLRWYLYLQPTGGIWHTAERKRHNVGAQLHYILRQDQKLRLYLGGGGAYFYDKEKTGVAGGKDVFGVSTEWNWGAGVGVERLLAARWALQVELDFIRYGDSGNIQVTPQAGLYFYW
jgi:hypothetical protein